MSLQVWLPFTSDLSNQGLSNISITNTDAVLDSSGRLGNCYSFNGSSSYLKATGYTDLGTEFSLCCWFKLSSVSGNIGLFCDRQVAYSGLAVYFNNGKLTLDPCATSYSSSTRWTTNFTATIDTWYHIAVTRTPTTIYVYINGQLQDSKDVAFESAYGNCFTVGAFNTNGSSIATYYSGALNDFRIYDHTLSQKEIKELSKGLVAHYKLSGVLDGINPNMFKDIPKSEDPTAYCAYELNFTENLVADETYTVQLWDVDVSHTGKTESQLGVALYWGGGTVRLVYWQGTSYFTNGHADYLTATFTVTSAQASGTGATNPWFRVYNSPGNATGDRNLVIGHWKLEKSSYATPYVKTAEELGLNENIVYDCSGYLRNGSVLGTLGTINDTPRYSASTIFDGDTSGVLLENFAISSVINNDITHSFWIKPNGESGARSVYFSSYSGVAWSIEKTTGNVLRLYWAGNPDESCSGATISDGVWQHICVAKKGEDDIKVYINGELKWSSTATHSSKSFPDTFRIGRDSRTGTTSYKGQMSDFRIYATTLSADDILELYHTGASIDSDGNMYAYELKEI